MYEIRYATPSSLIGQLFFRRPLFFLRFRGSAAETEGFGETIDAQVVREKGTTADQTSAPDLHAWSCLSLSNYCFLSLPSNQFHTDCCEMA